jgi:hypothetical protein
VVAVVVGILGVVPVPVGFAAWGIIKCFRHRRGILFTVSVLTRCNSVSSPHSTSRSGSRSGRRLRSCPFALNLCSYSHSLRSYLYIQISCLYVQI